MSLSPEVLDLLTQLLEFSVLLQNERHQTFMSSYRYR